MQNNQFIKAMQFRFVCKAFDVNKKISDCEFETILQSARLSPSSFGLEPTRYIVVKTASMREKIRTFCWNQPQITEASHLVILTSKIADLYPQSAYTTAQFKRKTGKDEEALRLYKDERYGGFLKANNYQDSQNLFNWSVRQAYIAASSMMNMAAFMGIDSCAIEGFEKKELETLLGMDTFSEQIALLLTFGYRKENPKEPSPRLDLNDLVSYI